MKFKEFIISLCTSVKESISRFLTAFICTVLVYLTLSYEIIFTTNEYKVITSLIMSFALTAVLSVLLKIVHEYLFDKLTSVKQYILCGISCIVSFILIRMNFDSLYTVMAYTGIMIAMICFIFFILMRGENRDLSFPRLVTSWIFSAAICGVLSGGLSTCLAAFQALIFEWNDFYKLYSLVLLFVWVIGFINIFLSFIPKKDSPVPKSKIFRVFVLFAGLPLYILLIAILLLYLAKIVITRNMPVGEINWFASFASLFFIFFLLSVLQYTEKIARLFVKFGGYFLVPVLVMQAIAVFERINAYGLTTPRTVSLVLIVISILFIAGSIIIPKHLNKIALASGLIVLLVTVTPFNVIDMPIASQTKILETVLTKNGMLKDDKIVPNENVSEEDAEKIISSYEYLKYDAEKVPGFIQNSDKSIQEIFGFTRDYGINNGNNYKYANYTSKDSVDITGYDKMVKVNDSDNVIRVEHNGKEYEVDLIELAREFYSQYGDSNSELEIYKVNENVSLYFERFSFDLNPENDDVSYCYFNGYVLLKN